MVGRSASGAPAEQWRRYGEIDPYYGVFPLQRFGAQSLDDRARDEFFESGRSSVRTLGALLDRHLPHDRPLRRVLDFGCGPGRLALAFAESAEEVLGVDVAPGMLAETQRNAAQADLDNVRTCLTDELEGQHSDFDLVHSELVLQHIRPEFGLPLIASLLRRVRPGGAVGLHVTTKPSSKTARVYFLTVLRAPFVARAWNRIRGKPWSYPLMEMHSYDLDELARLFAAEGFEVAVVRPLGAHTRMDFYAAWLLGRKDEPVSPPGLRCGR